MSNETTPLATPTNGLVTQPLDDVVDCHVGWCGCEYLFPRLDTLDNQLYYSGGFACTWWAVDECHVGGCAAVRQHLYFCTNKASKLSTCQSKVYRL